MEPSPVLVAPLQIHVRRGGEIVAGLKNSGVGDAGIEPDVKYVHLLFQVPAATGRAFHARREEFPRLALIPYVGAEFREQIGHVAHHRGIGDGLAAALADEGGYGHAPRALAGDTPVGPSLHHSVDAVPSPVGNPGDPVDLIQCLFAQSVGFHADEPLFGGAEDDGLLAAPAVGIGVGDLARTKEGACFGQLFNNALVGFEYLLAGEELHVFHEPAPVVHRVVDVEAESEPHHVVVLAVSGGGVDASGARFQGDVFAQEDHRIPVIERMGAVFLLQKAGLECGDNLTGRAGGGAERIQKTGGDDQDLASRVEGRVVEFGVE